MSTESCNRNTVVRRESVTFINLETLVGPSECTVLCVTAYCNNVTMNEKSLTVFPCCRTTKFTKQEIRTMYRGFKQVKYVFYSIVCTVLHSAVCVVQYILSYINIQHRMDYTGQYVL